MRTALIVSIYLSLIHFVIPAEFSSWWQGSRRWVGPEYWAAPMYDWQVVEGGVELELNKGRVLHLITHHLVDPAKGCSMEVEVEVPSAESVSKPGNVWAGFAVGAGGQMEDVRHVAVWTGDRIDVGLRADGRLMIGKKTSKEVLKGTGRAVLKFLVGAEGVELSAERGDARLDLTSQLPVGSLKGNLCLSGSAPKKPGSLRARFWNWKISGEGFEESGVDPFGPVLWTQYTRQGGHVKMSAQMPPLGADDDSNLRIEVRRKGAVEWVKVGKEAIHPMARTAVFSFDLPEADGVWEYRTLYEWEGKDRVWGGLLAEDPEVRGGPFRIGVFSCDNGYAFPLPTMTRNVAIQDPDLMFFAGDQIYESYGAFGLVREPVEKAMLDYLRKFYQFGWTWRELLKDRPSVILPDDHDVFQGNLWGAGGRAIGKIQMGGYVMPAEWVKAVERTQVAHLPDPVDPTPIKQGIGVCFTELKWGGVRMAILEDRKWKSGPHEVLPDHRYRLKAAELMAIDASMLGERQEKFLNEWAEETRDDPLRLVLSQTIFCKGTTHSGPELKRSRMDFDCNGWPPSGRRRALLPLKGGNTVMLHGDQHLGLLVRQGVDDWNDGPWAFMVPGTANGWPRAWWPESGEITGDFTDPLGNKFTVLGAGNPEKGSNSLDPVKNDPPEKTAHLKGSGHGIVRISPDKREVEFEMWRYQFDAAAPKPSDQFEGFPQTISVGGK